MEDNAVFLQVMLTRPDSLPLTSMAAFQSPSSKGGWEILMGSRKLS